MVTTIQQALRPFFVTYFIMGLNVYPITRLTSKIPWITCFSILYSLVIWFAFIYLHYYTVTLFAWKTLYPSTIYFIAGMVNNLNTIVIIIMSFYHHKKLWMCIKRLAVVNDTLEQMGTPKAYRKMHIYAKRILIGWIVYNIIENFYDSLWWLEIKLDITWALFLPYILNHCAYVNTFVDLLLIFLLWYIGTRFDKVNEHMRCLLENEKYVTKYKRKNSAVYLHRYVCTDDYKHTLWTLMHLHLELRRIARELNLIFGTQITFQMLSYITNITILCFGLNILLMQYRKIISLYHWSHIGCWILTNIMKIWMINYVYECVRIKAKTIDKIFHQVTNIIRYADIWNEISQFILQAIQHPLKFTGMGLFYFGNNFLRKLCTTVLMYVIIMIQMKIRIF